MFPSGIADEAGQPLATQIRAHTELGWRHIEMRLVDRVQFTDLDAAAFDAACGELEAAGLQVSCFASALANWARPVTGDFAKDVSDLERAIPRMQRLRTPFIRTMSWPNDGLDDPAWGDEAVRRMKELAARAEHGGVVLVLENCDGWASQSPEHMARFLERVDSPALKIVYDTGNPAAKGFDNTWAWYKACKPHIAYIHIKSHTGPLPDDPKGRGAWPEEGASLVRETLADLYASGYDGGVSIEPHLKAVIHEGKDADAAQGAYETYVEYGRRVSRMLAGITGAGG
jgi:sugar phosphate isomerase/epimerase